MDLVICSTPYQIFTAINLKCSGLLSSDSDLIVFDYAAGIDTICDRLKKENLFSCVRLSKTKDYFSKCTSGKVKGFLWTGYYLFLKKRFVERIAYIKKYDRIFYSFADPSIVIICDYFRKTYGNIEFIGFEDGLSNYYNKQNTYIQKNICRFFRIDKSIYFRKKTYMYCPELAPDPNGEYILTKIPPVFRTEYCRRILNRVFAWTSECEISERVVYFDQLPHYRVGATDDFNRKMTKMLKVKFGHDLIVKTHPRRIDNIYEEEGVNVYKYNSIPFELCCMNSTFDESVFITNISSACFMPKMIFGQEPRLVFLFHLEHKKNDKSIADFLQRFTASYSDKSRIYFPESVDDLNIIFNHKKNEN